MLLLSKFQMLPLLYDSSNERKFVLWHFLNQLDQYSGTGKNYVLGPVLFDLQGQEFRPFLLFGWPYFEVGDHNRRVDDPVDLDLVADEILQGRLDVEIFKAVHLEVVF